MKKNGFTFIEILGVVTLLALIGTIIIITVDKSIKDSKQTITKAQMENIRSSASMWMADNIEKIPNNGYYTINLETLEKEGYISEEIEKTIEINKNNYIIQISMNNILIGEETGFNTMDAFITDNASKQIETIKNQQLSLTGAYDLNEAGQITDGINTYETNIKETQLKGGYLKYRNDNLVSGCMTIDEYKVTLKDEKIIKIENGVCEKPYKCVRAIEKHTEECTNTSTGFCYEDGYTIGGSENTKTIEYGKLGKNGENPESGDIFNCDVNGDGTYDSETERFYYITDFTTTDNKQYGVLIYYSNTALDNNGYAIPDGSEACYIAYDSNNTNYNGPITAINNLPTINEWINIRLSSNTRAILNEDGKDTSASGSKKYPEAFDYSKNVNGTIVPLAARMLTYQEVITVCGPTPSTRGYLKNCNYLLEKTRYSSSTIKPFGFWLETPTKSNSTYPYSLGATSRTMAFNTEAQTATSRGVRPVIEVLKTDISLY